ncbi:uncharacterized protein LOC144100600 [Amblyomma americanum]
MVRRSRSPLPRVRYLRRVWMPAQETCPPSVPPTTVGWRAKKPERGLGRHQLPGQQCWGLRDNATGATRVGDGGALE